MNSHERVIRAVELEGPDTVPLFYGYLPGARWKYGEELEKILSRFPSDLVDLTAYQTHFLGREEPRVLKGTHIDEWGVGWQNVQGGMYGQPRVHPLADWRALETYEFPNPLDDDIFDKVAEYVRKTNHEKYIVVWETLVFQRMCFLRGFNNVMVDLFSRPKALRQLMDQVLDYNVARVKIWSELDVDGVIFSEDCGTQRGMMIDPRLWRELFRSEKEELFSILHKMGKHAFYHSDGDVMDIIPDLMDCGVDGLYVQLTYMLPGMSIDELGRRFGGRLCFISDLDRQSLVPFGTVEKVRQMVKHVIRVLGYCDGGLIGGAELGPEVPLANIEAIYESFERWGKYPLHDL